MSTDTKLLAKIDAVLTDDLKDSYLEYAIDVETINSISLNLFAEVEFIEAANLDQVIATSTFAWAMFPYECPLLPYQELIEAEGEVSRSYVAKLLHQHFHRRVREKLDLTPLSESEKAAWLAGKGDRLFLYGKKLYRSLAQKNALIITARKLIFSR